MKELAEPGVNYKNKEVRIATREDVLGPNSTDIMLLVHKYVRGSSDHTATPDEAWRIIKEGIAKADMNMLLILHIPDGEVKGFMHAQLRDDPLTGDEVAFIHGVYLSPKRDNKNVISEGLKILETWAKYAGVKKAKFFTFRTPGAHKFMIKQGWRHSITSYTKEL